MNIATILDRNISDSRLNVSAIYINSGIPPKRFDLLFISLISRKFTSWQEYQKKINSFFALLWRQHFPCAGLARFFLSFCETEEQAYSHRPLQFGVAGGYPCPWCPTLAIWYDEISWLVQDQSTLEP